LIIFWHPPDAIQFSKIGFFKRAIFILTILPLSVNRHLNFFLSILEPVEVEMIAAALFAVNLHLVSRSHLASSARPVIYSPPFYNVQEKIQKIFLVVWTSSLG